MKKGQNAEKSGKGRQASRELLSSTYTEGLLWGIIEQIALRIVFTFFLKVCVQHTYRDKSFCLRISCIWFSSGHGVLS